MDEQNNLQEQFTKDTTQNTPMSEPSVETVATEEIVSATQEQTVTLGPQENEVAKNVLSECFTPNTPEETPVDIFTPVTVGGPVNASNNGLRIFLGILCIVISLCLALTGGYIAGRSYVPKKAEINVSLAEKPDISQQQTALQVYESVKNSMVGILVYSQDGKSQSLGSGIIYTADGYIITNDHLLTDIPSPNFTVYTCDGTEYEAEFIAGDTRSDLAVLKIKGKFTPVVMGDSEDLLVGENVVAIGYPAGVLEKPVLTTGCVSSVGRRISSTTSYSTKVIQTDAAINPGSSGGGLLNMYGQVVGITSAKTAGEEYDRVGFAIPSKTVKWIVDALIQDGCVKQRAKLGVSYYEVTSATAKLNDLPAGLYIAEIAVESDLSTKDVEPGDIITHINDTKITNGNIALDIIDASKAGDVLNLTVYKAKTKKTIAVTITLISDPGSSSYTLAEAQSSGTTSNSSGGSFNFPFGD